MVRFARRFDYLETAETADSIFVTLFRCRLCRLFFSKRQRLLKLVSKNTSNISNTVTRGHAPLLCYFVTMLLCAEAERLELIKSLRDEGKTLKEIAESLGYKDHSAVSKLLKRNSN